MCYNNLEYSVPYYARIIYSSHKGEIIKMAFDKLILGEEELSDFEDLFIRDRIIERLHPDFSSFSDIIEPNKKARNNNKKRLLLSIMLFDKFDAVNMTKYDLSPLIDCGLIAEKSCLVNGTDEKHPTSIIIDSVWQYERKLMACVFKITESLFAMENVDAYPKNLVTEEETLDLCDAFILGTQRDFLDEYKKLLRIMLHNWTKTVFSGDIVYGSEMLTKDEQEELLDSILVIASKKIDTIYGVLSSVPNEEESLSKYLCLCEELESNIQLYSVPFGCSSCSRDWQKCCKASEFMYNCTFDCPNRDRMGEQRYAKFNGLILSSEANAVLFDNSIKFQGENRSCMKITEDIYHIVNIDLSEQVESLPVPRNTKEAIRIRNRPEITSFRNILYHWGECLSSGNFGESEYIARDFDAARKYFEKKEISNQKKKSIFHCFFEALGNQIPYLSNVAGIISPFITRRKIIEEEKHRWFLLTR